jgi:sugar (pentulose or hexulose) kinase|tara:strand:+ start:4501 stop:5802 length:1302 start_codon:yes stop_codon:yes gene_type:complete
MRKVIAIFDIGKTNKKILLYNKHLEVVYSSSINFKEVVDDDNFPCDDIESIEKWIKEEIKTIQLKNEFTIKAINFSTHGATLVYLGKNGNRVAPVYNYLKPLDFDFTSFYEANEGVEEFSRKTGSPAYGTLNAGLQMYWLKNKKPHYWSRVRYILHYPQYLSYLFSKKITADYTSIGAHTAIWDFDTMQYHNWLEIESISLPKPKSGKKATLSLINEQEVFVGNGLHDSTSSIIPLLESLQNSKTEFILLSTGTWIVCMNPFSKEALTLNQLKNNCLCYMTPNRQPIKSSMKLLGKLHDEINIRLSAYFGVNINYCLELTLNKKLCSELISKSISIFHLSEIKNDFEIDYFSSFELAYYQLIYEITLCVFNSINLILDSKNNLKEIYISGGFSKNCIFAEYLTQMMPEQKVKFSDEINLSSAGAAIMMSRYLN